ncbi:MAG TPA: ABC transporter ATP-binding protein [Anaerolineae bacterium]
MLEVQNLDVFYGHIQAMRGVSLRVERNEAVAVLGANGAGKSTLIKTLTGWQRPAAGRVLLDGQEITTMPAWQRVQLGLATVPEGGRVFRDLTVRQNLQLGAYLGRAAAAGPEIDRIFELFPVLRERERQVAKTLSGGEQQMLAIGRALMTQPKLLLIDEVSMGLMPILVKKVFSVIDQLRQSGVSILLVEQNAFEALKVVDRGYVLENGRLVLEGTAAHLSENPRVRAAYLGG